MQVSWSQPARCYAVRHHVCEGDRRPSEACPRTASVNTRCVCSPDYLGLHPFTPSTLLTLLDPGATSFPQGNPSWPASEAGRLGMCLRSSICLSRGTSVTASGRLPVGVLP